MERNAGSLEKANTEQLRAQMQELQGLSISPEFNQFSLP